MKNKIEALKNLEQGALGLHAQMLVVKELLNSEYLMKIRKEDKTNSEIKNTIDSITNILEDCNLIFTKDIY